MCRLALAFVIATCVGFAVGAAKRDVCAGCPVDADPNDPKLMTELKAVLATVHTNEKPLRITKAQTQVVAGIRTMVDFVTESNKRCHASWVGQPWISKQPQYVKFDCD